MCYGGLDPKYITADIEARVKSVAFGADKKEEPGQSKRGVLATLRALGTGWMRKGLSHV
jgi:hypothetical protein